MGLGQEANDAGGYPLGGESEEGWQDLLGESGWLRDAGVSERAVQLSH